jgi:hypothetical protein
MARCFAKLKELYNFLITQYYFGCLPPPLLKERAGVRSKPAITKPLTPTTPLFHSSFLISIGREKSVAQKRHAKQKLRS